MTKFINVNQGVKMNLYKIFLIISTLLLSSCAVIQYPEPLTGSKADGIITVGYEYPAAYNPNNWQEEWEKADESANLRCKDWGYHRAVKFDLTYRKCIERNLYGCVRWREFIDYQCIE